MYTMAYDSKAMQKLCVYGILDMKMSNARGFTPPPEYNVSKFKKNEIFPIS